MARLKLLMGQIAAEWLAIRISKILLILAGLTVIVSAVTGFVLGFWIA